MMSVAEIMNVVRKNSNIKLQTYWIRDFEVADDSHPFQEEFLKFKDLSKALKEIGHDKVRIGSDASGQIFYDFSDYKRKVK